MLEKIIKKNEVVNAQEAEERKEQKEMMRKIRQDKIRKVSNRILINTIPATLGTIFGILILREVWSNTNPSVTPDVTETPVTE